MSTQKLSHFPHRQRRDCERFVETARTDLSYFSASPPSFLLRLLPYGLSDMRRPISQTLSNDALYGAFSSLNVVYAQPNTIAIAEIELREIAMQVLLFAVLIHALHAALEDREIAFR